MFGRILAGVQYGYMCGFMKIIENTTEFNISEKTAVAIGKFDGFHRGHQKLLRKLKEQKDNGLASVVFTFVPSPAAFFARQPMKDLMTVEEKRSIFRRIGVDYLIEYPFCQETADMEPFDYIKDVLVGRLNARCIVAGDDVSFGRNGAGGCGLLKEKASKYGYKVIVIDKVLYMEREISSTFVREEVKNGSMELVGRLLGAPYHIGGEIVHGRQLGRTIGMPTVNLLPAPEKLLPPNGVYFSYVRFFDGQLSGIKYPSITNIGTKPTIDKHEAMGVESYIYDFDRDVYGKSIEVFLLKFVRPEMCFGSIEELRSRMAYDIASGRRFHNLEF